MNAEKIKEVFSDEAFVKELFSKETPEEVQALLAEKDIDVTIDEVVKTKELLIKKAEQSESDIELSEDDLEEVAGGELLALIMVTVGCIIGFGGIGAIVVGDAVRRRW